MSKPDKDKQEEIQEIKSRIIANEVANLKLLAKLEILSPEAPYRYWAVSYTSQGQPIVVAKTPVGPG